MKWYLATYYLFIIGTSLLLNLSIIHAQSYEDITSDAGILHSFGADAFGGGVSFYDFNDDGWDDITLATQQGDSIVFYQNSPLGFHEVYFEGIHHAGHVKQILWCDYDNDGDKDLYVSGRSSENYIYKNDGSFGFTPYELPAPSPYATADTYGAAFGDYDMDGDLDLFICNRIESIPLSNQLFLNNGDGTMTDITSTFPFDTTYQLTFCASWIDFNNDLLPDLYTAEDRFNINQLYTNRGGGILVDECEDCGAEIVINAMSVCPGDYDNDGDLDIYISNTEEGNALLRNNGNETFTEVAAQTGVTYNEVAWGATFFDYDNDGDQDLYVSGSTNGSTMKNVLYENLDLLNFTEATAGFQGDSTRSFSHAIGDMNNDGYYDIAVLNILPDSSQLWQSSGGMNHWIKIKLLGTQSNRDGIGSWLEVWTAGKQQVKYTTCGVGYIAQNSATEIFGMASFQVVDTLIVKWPSGIIDKLYNIESNQLIEVKEGSSSDSHIDFEDAIISWHPNPTNGLLVVSFEPTILEPLTMNMIDSSGRSISMEGRSQRQGDQWMIDFTGLPSDVYIVTFRSSSHQKVLKVVKLN